VGVVGCYTEFLYVTDNVPSHGCRGGALYVPTMPALRTGSGKRKSVDALGISISDGVGNTGTEL